MKKLFVIFFSFLLFIPTNSFASNSIFDGILSKGNFTASMLKPTSGISNAYDKNLSTSVTVGFGTSGNNQLIFNFNDTENISGFYVSNSIICGTGSLLLKFYDSSNNLMASYDAFTYNRTYKEITPLAGVKKAVLSVGCANNALVYEVEFYEAIPRTTPPPVPNGLKLDAIDYDFADVSWNSVSDNLLKGYNLYLNSNKINSSLITSTSFSINDLSPDTNYSLQVSAVDIWGNESAKSSPLFFKTLVVPRYPIISVSSKSHSTIRIVWDDLNASKYEIYVDDKLVDNTIYNFYEITNLKPNTTYKIKVVSIDKSYRRLESNVINETTNHVSLQKPVFLVSSKTHNSINVYWYKVEFADNYTLFLNDNELETINSLQYEFTNLQPNTEYRLKIRANSVFSTSESSITVKTNVAPVPTITFAKLNPVAGEPFKRTLNYTHENGVTGVKVYINGQLVGTYPISQADIPIDLSEYSSKPVVKLRLEPVDTNGKGFDLTTTVQPTDSPADDFLGYLLEIFDIIIRGFLIIAIASIPLLVVVIAFFWFRRKLKKEVHGATGPTGKDTALLSNTSGKFNALEIPDSSNMMKYLHGRKQKLREQSNYQDRGFRIHEKKLTYRNVGLFGVKKHVDITYERDGVLYKRRYIRGKGKVFVPKDFANRRKHIQNQFRSIASVFQGGVKRSGKKA